MATCVITFAGSSISRRLCQALPDDPKLSTLDKTVSGGGILTQNKSSTRHSIFISLDKFKNDKFVCIQIGGNDFFAHQKSGFHFTNVQIFHSSGTVKKFCQIVNKFLSDFKGEIVWIVGLMPRYLNICCCSEHHLDEKNTANILSLVNKVNHNLQRMCDYFSKHQSKNIIFIDPKTLLPHDVSWEDSSTDHVHLKSSINDHCALRLLHCIKYHLK